MKLEGVESPSFRISIEARTAPRRLDVLQVAVVCALDLIAAGHKLLRSASVRETAEILGYFEDERSFSLISRPREYSTQ